jgi:hypothetical protein
MTHQQIADALAALNRSENEAREAAVRNNDEARFVLRSHCGALGHAFKVSREYMYQNRVCVVCGQIEA